MVLLERISLERWAVWFCQKESHLRGGQRGTAWPWPQPRPPWPHFWPLGPASGPRPGPPYELQSAEPAQKTTKLSIKREFINESIRLARALHIQYKSGRILFCSLCPVCCLAGQGSVHMYSTQLMYNHRISILRRRALPCTVPPVLLELPDLLFNRETLI